MSRGVICIVEPDEAVRNGLATLLADIGADVETFSSAEELLDRIERIRPACLIAETGLPGLSGIELFEHLKAAGRIVPTILLTLDTEVATAVRAIRAGVVDYFEKPFIQRSLYRKVAAIIRERDAASRRPKTADHI